MSGWMIVVLLIVAFIAWHFIPEAKPPGPSPKFRREDRAKADDPRWQKIIEEHCESPAETAFLRAMIGEYDLSPDGGSLRAAGMKLDFQVEEGRYRVDFLANNWLVIEIDGAAFHSSPEAKTRDKARDLYFEGLGYRVLRIPAKTVFDRPADAISLVRLALIAGKPEIEAAPPTSGFERLSRSVADVGIAFEEANQSIRVQRAIQFSLKLPREVFFK